MGDALRMNAAAGAVDWLRILVEVIDAPAVEAVTIADGILRCLDEGPVAAPRLLHGEGSSCWPLIAHAGRLGLATRVGLEDTIAGPDGSPVTCNADLVRLAIQIWSQR